MRLCLIALTAYFFCNSCGWAQEAPPRLALRIAVIQMDASEVGDFVLMKARALEAKKRGAQIVVFPEAAVFGWLNAEVFTKSEPIPGIHSQAFAAIAREADIWIASGLAERGPAASGHTDVFEVYDAGILLNPKGEIVLHHRKHSVLKNAFDTDACQRIFNTDGCSYTSAPIDSIKTVDTPFGRLAILVCADAFTYDPEVLAKLKSLKPELVIVPWGIAAGSREECGQDGFNATGFASVAAKYLETAFVVGANPVGERKYGRFRPSWYCGTSGYAEPGGRVGGVATSSQTVALFDIPLGVLNIPTESAAILAGKSVSSFWDGPADAPNFSASHDEQPVFRAKAPPWMQELLE